MLGVPVETVSARRRRQRRAADTRPGYEAHNWTRPVWTPDYRMLGVPVETVSARRRRQRRAAAARPSPHTATRVGWRELFCREVRKVCPEADIRFVQGRNVTLTHSTNRVVSIAGKAGTAGSSLAGAAQNAAGEAGAAGLLLSGAAPNSICLGSGRDPDQQFLGVNQVSARLNCHQSQIIEELADSPVKLRDSFGLGAPSYPNRGQHVASCAVKFVGHAEPRIVHAVLGHEHPWGGVV